MKLSKKANLLFKLATSDAATPEARREAYAAYLRICQKTHQDPSDTLHGYAIQADTPQPVMDHHCTIIPLWGAK